MYVYKNKVPIYGFLKVSYFIYFFVVVVVVNSGFLKYKKLDAKYTRQTFRQRYGS